MPSLPFILPHWLYWSGLILFPIIVMLILWRRGDQVKAPRASLALSYMLLITGGFVGLHRYYVRSKIGLAYLPFFFGILFANGQGRDARDGLSSARRDLSNAQYDVEFATEDLAAGLDGAQEALDKAQAAVRDLQASLNGAAEVMAQWDLYAGGLAGLIALFLLVDLVLLPNLVRRRRAAQDAAGIQATATKTTEDIEKEVLGGDDTAPRMDSSATRFIDGISRVTGEFVAYWAVVAVMVYYYEVVARYVFNSPTNWAHESMYLMFGMMFLISGAFAYLNDSHVRVDLFYARLSTRGKAWSDLITSLFFFVFVGTMVWTGWTFFVQAAEVYEKSLTEWEIQYYPVKGMIALGGFLILLQGISKFLKDIMVLRALKA